MRQTLGFLFFMLFLAGFAFVMLGNLKSAESLREQGAGAVTIISGVWSDEKDGPGDQQAITIHFQADGRVTGFAGCNDFFGSFVATDKTLEIGPLGATRKACPAPIMQQETAFLAAIESTTDYYIDGSKLVLGDGERTTSRLTLSKD